MVTEQRLTYSGGTLVVTGVEALKENGALQILLGDAALIDLYKRVLNEKGILGDIEVSMGEIREKYGGMLSDPIPDRPLG